MAIETLVGLHVVDEKGYQMYRNEMTPILDNYGGGFGYDFTVSKVFKSKTNAPINRVFTISFPDQGSKDSFFSNSEYLKIRQRHFDKSVTDTTMIATYESQENALLPLDQHYAWFKNLSGHLREVCITARMRTS